MSETYKNSTSSSLNLELFIKTLCFYLAAVYILGFFVSVLGLGGRTSYTLVCITSAVIVVIRLKPFSISLFKLAIVAQIYLLGYLLFFWNYDLSVDGNTYHASIIHRLLSGWNMFTQTDTPYYSGKPWIENYPKNAELLFAIFSSPFGSTDFGRIAKLLFIEIAGALAFYFGKRVLNLPSSISLAFACAVLFNPVIVSQLFTRYIDDIVCLSIANIIFSSFLNMELIAVGFFLFAIGIKYSSLFIAVPILALLFLMNRFLLKKRFSLNLGGAIIVCIIGLFSISFYAYNLITKNNPLYPIFETKLIKAYTVEGVVPESLKDNNFFERFLISNLSFPGGLIVEKIDAKDNLFKRLLKVLKTYQYYNLYRYGFSGYLIFPDCKINGFGFFWPFLITISSAVLLVALTQSLLNTRIFKDNKQPSVLLFTSFTIYLTSILFPANWWARLIAHLWLMPLFVAGFLFKRRYKSSKIIALIIVLVMILNSLPLLFFVAHHNLKMSSALKSQISSARLLAKDSDAVWVYMHMVEFADERIKLGLKGFDLKFYKVNKIEDFLKVCQGKKLFSTPLWIPSPPPLFCLATQKASKDF